MKKAKTTQITIAIATVALLFSIINGILPAQALTKPKAQGAGSFLHEHEGMTCTHNFVFSVSDGISEPDGWYYKPSGVFTLVCSNSTAVCMIITSLQIVRFKVVPLVGGLSVTFEGLAKVNMGNGWM